MKRVFLSVVVPALLIAMGFAQTPAASVNPDQTIKGCLGGSNGNYTVMEDGTGRISKISTASVDFKQHLGHEVTLIGHKATVESSAAADNSFAVTELNMISEHCAAAAGAAIPSTGTTSETATTPPAAPGAPVATTSTLAPTEITPDAPAAATVTTPAETAAAPPAAATVTAPAETAAAPPAPTAVAPPAAATETVVPLPGDASATVSTTEDKPVAAAAEFKRPPASSRRVSPRSAAAAVTPAVTANTPPETASKPDAAAVAPAVTASTPPETAGPPPAASTTPAAPARRGAVFLLILLAVVVIVIGTLVPFFSRWRKRKMLEQTGAENLSFTREAVSDQDKPEEPRKAA